ncbi:HD domain-containing phosphohydrolase [Methylomonas koyamae]|nr:HD domain-containing phosphohydrolase [Methylomonas koyamae]
MNDKKMQTILVVDDSPENVTDLSELLHPAYRVRVVTMGARIMAVADVFDSLISRRVYKPALPPADVKTIIAQGRDRHFDPDLADAFLADFDVYCAIAHHHPDVPQR